MTHEVKLETTDVTDAFEWCKQQGWQHIVDWRWFNPNYSRNYYIFQFDDPAKANWFALRWCA